MAPAELEPSDLRDESSRLRRRSYLGLELVLGRIDTEPRLFIESVDPGSPAEAAGLQPGGQLVSLANTAITGLDQVRRLVQSASLAAPTRVGVERDGTLQEFWVRATRMPLESVPNGRAVLDEVACEGHRLRAIWTFPDQAGPYPAIWMLPGAAWISEERPISPGGSLLELVRGLTSAGFATLRVDRSGLGDSEGQLCTDTDLHAELATWRAVYRYLSTHPDVRRSGSFLYARSLGGMLAPLIAREFPVRAVAVWGTSARRWDRAMLEAARRQYALAGTTGAALERLLVDLERLQHWLYGAGLTPEAAFQREPSLRSLESQNFRGNQLYRRNAAFFQQLARIDVASAWRELACPVLALHGSSDWLSQLEDCIEIAELAPRGTWRELDGIDHMMHARSSVEEAFAEPFTGTFCPKALEALVSFFRSQL